MKFTKKANVSALRKANPNDVHKLIEMRCQGVVFDIIQDLCRAGRIDEFPLPVVQLDFHSILKPVFQAFHMNDKYENKEVSH